MNVAMKMVIFGVLTAFVAGAGSPSTADAQDNSQAARRIAKLAQKIKDPGQRDVFHSAVDALGAQQSDEFLFKGTTPQELEPLSAQSLAALFKVLGGIRFGLPSSLETALDGEACGCVCASATNNLWSCSPAGCSTKDGTSCR